MGTHPFYDWFKIGVNTFQEKIEEFKRRMDQILVKRIRDTLKGIFEKLENKKGASKELINVIKTLYDKKNEFKNKTLLEGFVDESEKNENQEITHIFNLIRAAHKYAIDDTAKIDDIYDELINSTTNLEDDKKDTYYIHATDSSGPNPLLKPIKNLKTFLENIPIEKSIYRIKSTAVQATSTDFSSTNFAIKALKKDLAIGDIIEFTNGGIFTLDSIAKKNAEALRGKLTFADVDKDEIGVVVEKDNKIKSTQLHQTGDFDTSKYFKIKDLKKNLNIGDIIRFINGGLFTLSNKVEKGETELRGKLTIKEVKEDEIGIIQESQLSQFKTIAQTSSASSIYSMISYDEMGAYFSVFGESSIYDKPKIGTFRGSDIKDHFVRGIGDKHIYKGPERRYDKTSGEFYLMSKENASAGGFDFVNYNKTPLNEQLYEVELRGNFIYTASPNAGAPQTDITLKIKPIKYTLKITKGGVMLPKFKWSKGEANNEDELNLTKNTETGLDENISVMFTNSFVANDNDVYTFTVYNTEISPILKKDKIIKIKSMADQGKDTVFPTGSGTNFNIEPLPEDLYKDDIIRFTNGGIFTLDADADLGETALSGKLTLENVKNGETGLVEERIKVTYTPSSDYLHSPQIKHIDLNKNVISQNNDTAQIAKFTAVYKITLNKAITRQTGPGSDDVLNIKLIDDSVAKMKFVGFKKLGFMGIAAKNTIITSEKLESDKSDELFENLINNQYVYLYGDENLKADITDIEITYNITFNSNLTIGPNEPIYINPDDDNIKYSIVNEFVCNGKEIFEQFNVKPSSKLFQINEKSEYYKNYAFDRVKIQKMEKKDIDFDDFERKYKDNFFNVYLEESLYDNPGGGSLSFSENDCLTGGANELEDLGVIIKKKQSKILGCPIPGTSENIINNIITTDEYQEFMKAQYNNYTKDVKLKILSSTIVSLFQSSIRKLSISEITNTPIEELKNKFIEAYQKIKGKGQLKNEDLKEIPPLNINLYLFLYSIMQVILKKNDTNLRDSQLEKIKKLYESHFDLTQLLYMAPKNFEQKFKDKLDEIIKAIEEIKGLQLYSEKENIKAMIDSIETMYKEIKTEAEIKETDISGEEDEQPPEYEQPPGFHNNNNNPKFAELKTTTFEDEPLTAEEFETVKENLEIIAKEGEEGDIESAIESLKDFNKTEETEGYDKTPDDKTPILIAIETIQEENEKKKYKGYYENFLIKVEQLKAAAGGYRNLKTRKVKRKSKKKSSSSNKRSHSKRWKKHKYFLRYRFF